MLRSGSSLCAPALALISITACTPEPAELERAFRAGDATQLERLLARGGDPNREVEPGRTLTCLAAAEADPALLGLLLDHGAWPSEALWCALEPGRSEAAKLALAAGAKPDEPPFGQRESALTAAARSCEPATVEMLLATDAAVDGLGEVGRSYPPLSIAAGEGHTTCVALLLDAGADIERRDGLGNTALNNAVIQAHLDTVILLLDRHADPLAPNWAGHTAAFIASWREDLSAIRAELERRGVTHWDMVTPPKPPYNPANMIEVPVVEVQAAEG